MTWHIPALCSFILWGTTTIIVSKFVRLQPASASAFVYNFGIFSIGALTAVLTFKRTDLSAVNGPILGLTLLAGCLSGIAVMSQLWGFQKFPDKLPWIVLVGSLYPAMPILWALMQGTKLTGLQWSGIVFGFISIACLSFSSR